MSALLEKVRRLPERFDTLSGRERVMILVLVVAALVGGWFNLLWYPQSMQQRQIGDNIDALDAQIKQLDVQLAGLVKRAEQDPNEKIRQELEQLKRFIAEMEGQIKGTTAALIEPREMAQLLERMLLSNESLQLVRLGTLKTEALMGGKRADSGQENAPVFDDPARVAEKNVYRHTFIIEFEGGYLAVLKYLKALEALPGRFFWDGIELKVTDYPSARVKLQLHTLSLSEGWIGV
ncbi:type II secretion system protein GspM [Sedimenticola hydrogenitrophicus]|uniref:type II secretion system protein GspM n=1 Tax=Sedimenticola hydrogenitrophicus TaxID=2967975 RepID=UPI0021A94F28|nr:type II secretion system protein GspM [Sedimenticola hydrogenitrophicus]